MKRIIPVILIFSVLFFLFIDAEAAENTDQAQQEQILSAAENLFVLMKNKNYTAIWSVLSKKTQAAIVNDVRKENEKANKKNTKANLETNKDAIFNDFLTGGDNAKAYWNNFLTVFNPDIVLERCKWEMGKTGKNEAQLLLLHKTSEKPAIIKMFKENNEWKVGLDESFSVRKDMLF
jgi:hypothetical protein